MEFDSEDQWYVQTRNCLMEKKYTSLNDIDVQTDT